MRKNIGEHTAQLAETVTGIINVVTGFGADPTGLSDSTLAIKLAIDKAKTERRVLYFPTGDYLVSNTLDIDSGVIVRGERIGSGGTSITTSANKPVFYVTSVCSIEGIAFQGTNDLLATNQIGILVDNTSNVNIIGCFFDRLYNGIQINETVFYTTIDSCRFYSAQNALICGGGVVESGYQVTINNCIASVSHSKYGFYFENAGTVTINDLEMSPTNCTDGGVVFASLATNAGIQQITHSRLEGSLDSGLKMLGSPENPIRNLFVSNTYIAGDPACYIDYASEIFFNNCFFTGSSDGGSRRNAIKVYKVGKNIEIVNCKYDVTDVALTADEACEKISLDVVNPIFYGGLPFIYLPFLESSVIDRISVYGGKVGVAATPIALSTHDVDKVSVNVAGIQVLDDWKQVPLVNSWENFGGEYSTAGYMKDSNGFVHLKGFIKNGISTRDTTLFTLPVGYRPPEVLVIPNIASNAGAAVPFVLEILKNGSVSIGVINAANTWLCLDGISFRVS